MKVKARMFKIEKEKTDNKADTYRCAIIATGEKSEIDKLYADIEKLSVCQHEFKALNGMSEFKEKCQKCGATRY